jgi:hypothetical protein
MPCTGKTKVHPACLAKPSAISSASKEFKAIKKDAHIKRLLKIGFIGNW